MFTISLEFSWFGTFFDFPSNFVEFVHSTNSNFFSNSELLVCLLYIIFHWTFMIFYWQQNQISQQARTICTSYIQNFPLNFHDLVRSSIFHRIFTNLYNQRIWIFLQISTIYTLLYKNFHWIFMTLYHQRNQIS